MPSFCVKLGANDLNCVDVTLYPTHTPCICYMVQMCMDITQIFVGEILKNIATVYYT